MSNYVTHLQDYFGKRYDERSFITFDFQKVWQNAPSFNDDDFIRFYSSNGEKSNIHTLSKEITTKDIDNLTDVASKLYGNIDITLNAIRSLPYGLTRPLYASVIVDGNYDGFYIKKCNSSQDFRPYGFEYVRNIYNLQDYNFIFNSDYIIETHVNGTIGVNSPLCSLENYLSFAALQCITGLADMHDRNYIYNADKQQYIPIDFDKMKAYTTEEIKDIMNDAKNVIMAKEELESIYNNLLTSVKNHYMPILNERKLQLSSLSKILYSLPNKKFHSLANYWNNEDKFNNIF